MTAVTSTAPRRVRRVAVSLAVAAAAVASVVLAPVAHADPVVATPPTAASADALPTVQINGTAVAQVVVGNTVYVVGSFTSARPAGSPLGTNETPREYILAYDITTGNLLDFHHVLNADATSIVASADGSRIYVGGKFTTVDGLNRYRLVAFDTATGALVTAFKPVPNATVSALAITPSAVYLAGSFGNVNGVARTRAAAVDPNTGALLPWAPTIDNYGVNAMVVTPDQTGVILGGRFSSINGQAAFGSAAVDATTGATRPWALNQVIKGSNTAGTYTLSTDGSLIFGGNYTYGNGNFEGTWAADPATGNIVWANDCLGDTYSVFPMNGLLYVSGHSHSCAAAGYFPETNPRSWHYALAYSTSPSSNYNTGPDAYNWNYSAYHTSQLQQWFPTLAGSTTGDSSQAAWSVSGNADYIVYAGEFPRVNNTNQQGLVRFPVHAISPNVYGPQNMGTATASLTRNASGSYSVTVTAKGAYDRDDALLTYQLYRGNNQLIASTTAPVTGFWTTQANVSLTDPNVPANASYTYKLMASDPWGRKASVTVAVSTAVPTWTPTAGAVSSSGGNQAAVGPTTLSGTTLTVPFTATGSPWTLPQPTGSCLQVGATTVAPTAITLTTSQWGRYVGTATYTLPVSGSYGWQYACNSAYSVPTIGVATIPGA